MWLIVRDVHVSVLVVLITTIAGTSQLFIHSQDGCIVMPENVSFNWMHMLKRPRVQSVQKHTNTSLCEVQTLQ